MEGQPITQLSSANTQPGFISCLPPAPTYPSSLEASVMLWLIWMVAGMLPSPALNFTPPELGLHCAAHRIFCELQRSFSPGKLPTSRLFPLVNSIWQLLSNSPCHSVIISALSAVSGWVFRCSWGQSAIFPKSYCVLKKKNLSLLISHHPSAWSPKHIHFTSLHPADVSPR